MKRMATLVSLSGMVLCIGCGGQRTIDEVQSLEYMNSREGKTLVYPEGVDTPNESSAYAIPPLSPAVAGTEYDINELARPPALFDHDRPGDEDGEDPAPDNGGE